MKIKILRLSFFFPIFISLLFIGATSSLAQKKKKAYPVHAKDSLVIDTHSSKTLSEALAECIRKAQIQAIKDRFGTNLSEDKKLNTSTIDGVSSQSFMATMSENLKGSWLRETQEPIILVDYKEGNCRAFGIDQIAVIQGTSGRSMDEDYDYLTSDVDSMIRSGYSQRNNTYALIIGNQKYRDVTNVSYAIHDARVFEEYCKKNPRHTCRAYPSFRECHKTDDS